MIKPKKRHTRLKSFVENPSKSLWTLAIPIIAGMGIQTLYSIVDMIFIGKLSGDAIAAVAFNFPIFFFVKAKHIETSNNSPHPCKCSSLQILYASPK